MIRKLEPLKAGDTSLAAPSIDDCQIYPVVEAPPLANLPMESMGSEQLQQLRAEVIGLKGRSADVQRQMFEGLVQGEEERQLLYKEL